jgi:hypothetical protein
VSRLTPGAMVPENSRILAMPLRQSS